MQDGLPHAGKRCHGSLLPSSVHSYLSSDQGKQEGDSIAGRKVSTSVPADNIRSPRIDEPCMILQKDFQGFTKDEIMKTLLRICPPDASSMERSQQDLASQSQHRSQSMMLEMMFPLAGS